MYKRQPIRDFKLYQKDKAVRGLLNFGCLDEPLVVKTGISYTSEDGCLLYTSLTRFNEYFLIAVLIGCTI